MKSSNSSRLTASVQRFLIRSVMRERASASSLARRITHVIKVDIYFLSTSLPSPFTMSDSVGTCNQTDYGFVCVGGNEDYETGLKPAFVEVRKALQLRLIS